METTNHSNDLPAGKKVRYRIEGYEWDTKYLEFNAYCNFLLEIAREKQPQFVIDEYNKEVFRKLCLYFWQHPDFETEGHGSLNKGILLVGGVGTGKTWLINLFRRNVIGDYSVWNTNDIADEYQHNGIGGLTEQFIGNSEAKMPSIAFDDLGSERTSVKHMGNELNAMERVILARYRYRNYHRTHFTSNLNGDQIEEAYGTRVRSRLREMVNFITLKGNDRRK
jgi:hypothetical protein